LQTETKIVEEAEEQLSPSDAGSALDRSFLLGLAWTGAMKWGTQVLSWASTIIIARLLTPSDYGLMGMATVYLGLVALVNEFGLTAAILQHRNLTEEQIARLGGLSILVGTGLCLLSIAMAYPVSLFYHNPAVRPVVMVLSINFVLASIGVLPRSLLARGLEYPKLAWSDGLSQLAQMATTLVLAMLGYRYWSLVFGSIAGSIAATLLILSWKRHPLAWPRQLRTISGAVHMGWNVVVGRVAWYSYMNADFVVIGRVLGQAALGSYTLGWEIATVPVERVSALVS
jgi:O-antigen/teichoic acid export membrane protein